MNARLQCSKATSEGRLEDAIGEQKGQLALESDEIEGQRRYRRNR